MTQYTRTISRITTTPSVPQWYRDILTANGGTFPTNKLYEVGKRWDDPVDGFNVKERAIWDTFDTTYGGGLYNGTDGTFSVLHDAYGGSVYVPELGAYGTMVFGSTGENVIIEQLESWSMSDDDPAWNVFQAPSYAQTAAAATTRGASAYYSPGDFAALQASKPGNIAPWGPGTGDTETGGGWNVSWDRTFPVGRGGWIIGTGPGNTGKVGISELGNNRPMSFRYNTNVYIPPAMTGTGVGAILVNDRSFHGWFAGSRGPQVGITPSQWFSDVWPSGRQKFYLYAMNVQTKAWTPVIAIPDYIDTTAQSYANVAAGFVDPTTKRAYYFGVNSGTVVTYYADFSAGIAGATVSGVTPILGAGGAWMGGVSNTPLFVGTSGALTGRKLWYYRTAGGHLAMYDVVANTAYDLNVASPPPSLGVGWMMGVDQANARVYIMDRSASGITVSKFDIPSAPEVAANYSISTTPVNMNGLTPETVANGPYGDRNYFIPGLGMFLNPRTGKMLFLKPG
jgi:hypothetical protein